MSTESAREFLSRALEDEELLERLSRAPKGQRQRIAREAGYDFDERELRAAREELSDAPQLSADAGSLVNRRIPVLLYGVVDTW